MNLRLLPLLLAAAGVVASTQAGCAAPTDDEDSESSAEALTGGRIVVRGFGSPGSQVGKWGYDIKQDGRSKAMSPALAKEIFVDIGMNMLRVPVRAADAHPARGVENIKVGEYAEDIDAIKTVMAARPGVEIFASVKLLGPKSFPGWVKDGGEVDAGKYSALLESYLAFMASKGITVDWLGVDNERRFNEGNITPGKYNAIVANVKAFCREKNLKVPGFIAAEDYGPGEDVPWLQNLWQSNAQFQHVDHVGVHIYSKHRDAGYVAQMQRLTQADHGKGLWDSELHWNDQNDDDNVGFDDIKSGMLTAFDHFDDGYKAVSWWAFQPRSRGSKSAYVMSELVSSTIGANNLPTDDFDGKAPAMGKLTSRAFKNGPNEVTLWVANLDDKDRKDQKTEIANQKVAGAAYVQWSSSSRPEGRSGNASLAKKDKSVFAMDFPANTITRVTVSVK
ncbi:MAG: hypothetical protein JWP97_2253 [Labilithrix sp.]|nr:hypothetical protein [Labilithrix sp.]